MIFPYIQYVMCIFFYAESYATALLFNKKCLHEYKSWYSFVIFLKLKDLIL